MSCNRVSYKLDGKINEERAYKFVGTSGACKGYFNILKVSEMSFFNQENKQTTDTSDHLLDFVETAKNRSRDDLPSNQVYLPVQQSIDTGSIVEPSYPNGIKNFGPWKAFNNLGTVTEATEAPRAVLSGDTPYGGMIWKNTENKYMFASILNPYSGSSIYRGPELDISSWFDYTTYQIVNVPGRSGVLVVGISPSQSNYVVGTFIQCDVKSDYSGQSFATSVSVPLSDNPQAETDSSFCVVPSAFQTTRFYVIIHNGSAENIKYNSFYIDEELLIAGSINDTNLVDASDQLIPLIPESVMVSCGQSGPGGFVFAQGNQLYFATEDSETNSITCTYQFEPLGNFQKIITLRSDIIDFDLITGYVNTILVAYKAFDGVGVGIMMYRMEAPDAASLQFMEGVFAPSDVYNILGIAISESLEDSDGGREISFALFIEVIPANVTLLVYLFASQSSPESEMETNYGYSTEFVTNEIAFFEDDLGPEWNYQVDKQFSSLYLSNCLLFAARSKDGHIGVQLCSRLPFDGANHSGLCVETLEINPELPPEDPLQLAAIVPKGYVADGFVDLIPDNYYYINKYEGDIFTPYDERYGRYVFGRALSKTQMLILFVEQD